MHLKLASHCKITSVILFATILGACTVTPQPAVTMNFQSLNNAPSGVAVAFQALPDASLMLPGADCLLCIAAASAANSGLSGVVKTYSTSEIEELQPLLVNKLKASGKPVTVIDALDMKNLPKFKSEEPGFAKRDMSSVGQANDASHVVVVEYNHVGVVRPYASYVPTGAPYASISGVAYAVDVRDNSYTWYEPIAMQMQADGDWKEDPDYHNVTNAYYRLVEGLRDKLLAALTENTVAVPVDPAPGEVEEAATE